MIDIKLNVDDEDKQFFIPESWDEVNLEQFCRLYQFNRDFLTPIETAVRTLHIFTGIDEDTIMMFNYDDFQKLCSIIEFTTTEIESKLIESININGEEYFLKKEFDKLTMGEIISIEVILNDSQGNIMGCMDKLLCIFLRKKKPNGKLENFKSDFMERVKIFRDLPISQIYGLFIFFLDGGILLDETMKGSLESQK